MSQSPSDGWTEETGLPSLRTNARLKLLAAEHRRVTLDVLHDEPLPIDLEDLAAAVAHRIDGDAADEEVEERVAIALHHKHLPLMADSGVIVYDPASFVVESWGPNRIR